MQTLNPNNEYEAGLLNLGYMVRKAFEGLEADKIDWDKVDTETKAEEEQEAVEGISEPTEAEENAYDAFKEHDCHLSGEDGCDNPIHQRAEAIIPEE